MRVVTGALDPLELWLADDGLEECEALVRVVTGALDPLVPARARCDTAAGAATAARARGYSAAAAGGAAVARGPGVVAAGAGPRCATGRPVRTAASGRDRAAGVRDRGRRARGARRGTVRRITCVRYSTAGLRAASVATGLSDGCSVYTANPPAAMAVMAAALRVCLVRN